MDRYKQLNRNVAIKFRQKERRKYPACELSLQCLTLKCKYFIMVLKTF